MNLSDLVHRTGNDAASITTHSAPCPSPGTFKTEFNTSSLNMDEYNLSMYRAKQDEQQEFDSNLDTHLQSQKDTQWSPVHPSPFSNEKIIGDHGLSQLMIPSQLTTPTGMEAVHPSPFSQIHLDNDQASPQSHQIPSSPRISTTSSPEPGQANTADATSSNNAADSALSAYYCNNDGQQIQLTVTGDNVTGTNIEYGYIQFVLRHDPSYIGDGIESLMYAKRKFSSVPKTADINYTTWDIFTLVKKLHNQEIKNWSQLVGQLGLSDMTGRPQFAQRVKRWMHKYKIDCYFDYLLGNSYSFHSSDEKYSGCLMMGNYYKRRSDRSRDESDHTLSSDEKRSVGRKRNTSLGHAEDGMNSDDDEDEDEEGGPNNHPPIVMAGSRKRLRDMSQSNLLVAEASSTASPHEERTDDEHDGMADTTALAAERSRRRRKIADNDDGNEEEDDEEEDELASSASSVASPYPEASWSIPAVDVKEEIVPMLGSTHTHPVEHRPPPPPSSCQKCEKLEKSLNLLQDTVDQLKGYVSTLEKRIEEQEAQTDANSKQWTRTRQRVEKWQRTVLENLLRDPIFPPDDDKGDGNG